MHKKISTFFKVEIFFYVGASSPRTHEPCVPTYTGLFGASHLKDLPTIRFNPYGVKYPHSGSYMNNRQVLRSKACKVASPHINHARRVWNPEPVDVLLTEEKKYPQSVGTHCPCVRSGNRVGRGYLFH